MLAEVIASYFETYLRSFSESTEWLHAGYSGAATLNRHSRPSRRLGGSVAKVSRTVRLAMQSRAVSGSLCRPTQDPPFLGGSRKDGVRTGEETVAKAKPFSEQELDFKCIKHCFLLFEEMGKWALCGQKACEVIGNHEVLSDSPLTCGERTLSIVGGNCGIQLHLDVSVALKGPSNE